MFCWYFHKIYCNEKIVLTSNSFPAAKALTFLGELQNKIYDNFPNLKSPNNEDESLTGARLYVSEICSKYSNEELSNSQHDSSLNQSPAPNLVKNPMPEQEVKDPVTAQQKLAEVQEKLRQDRSNMQSNIIPMPEQVSNIDPRNIQNSSYKTEEAQKMSVQRKILLAIFILACGLYIIVPIIRECSM